MSPAHPVLLTVAAFYGTLAAVRCLGRAGVPVTVADPSLLASSRWSTYATSRVFCPDVRDTVRFIEWLLDFARRAPKCVLLPTNDDTAWLYALHREELSRYFFLGPSSFDAVYGLVNKKLLHQHAAAVGLGVPRTWFPESPGDLGPCLREARFPVLVKPITQVLWKTRSKGVRVEKPGDLEAAYRRFAEQGHEPAILERDPGVRLPMIQEFDTAAAGGIYNLSGVAHEGEILALRAGRKLLQWPRRLGVGLCFEEAPVEAPLAAGLRRLVRRVGYSGVFEAEFIQNGEGNPLIDFNPRFYNQMGFDIARGLPAPLFAYAQALGQDEELAARARSAGAAEDLNGHVFAHRGSLRLLLFAQQLAGTMQAEEAKKWRAWRETHAERCTDAVYDPGDRVPALFDAADRLRHYARHPRNFVYSILFDR